MPPSNPNAQKPVSVLFVCLGNICRSPMAEGVFRHMTKHTLPTAHPLIAHIDSCGTDAYHIHEPPDPRTLAVLSAHSITAPFYTHTARRFHAQDFKDFDYIFAMDKSNEEDLLLVKRRLVGEGQLVEDEAGRVMLFGVWGGRGQEEVRDPYYGGPKGFDVAYEQVERFSRGFVTMLEERAQSSKEK